MNKRHEGEAERWILHARDEFADADELRKAGKYYLALFHFQQATEKALKGFLYLKAKSVQVFHTHAINDLLEIACEADQDFQEVTGAKKLDSYYIPTRYPNSLPGGVPSRYFDDPEEAEEAMELAKSVIDLVNRKTGKTTG